ncbi:MAG: hypothetical protein JWN70_605, partial [Planctomycetaceae bacterium]|nr:hypothetical protein [Planctomycetaceae bacterium]
EQTREDEPGGFGFQGQLAVTSRIPARRANPLQRFHDVVFPGR